MRFVITLFEVGLKDFQLFRANVAFRRCPDWNGACAAAVRRRDGGPLFIT